MKRPLIGLFLFGVFIFVVAGALTIPFIYESQTLWYKVGVDKTFLRTGQLLGLLAFLALGVQILLGTRGKVLQETFGVSSLVSWHKMNGVVLCCLAVSHVLFVLLPEGMTNLPLGMKNWPEMVGGVAVLLLFFQVIASFYRQKIGFNYMRWRMIHRGIGYLSLIFAAVHVLFVADSFAQGLPRIALLVVSAGVFVQVAFAKILIKLEKTK